MKKHILALAALSIVGAAAHADGLSANVSLTTKYKYRGQDQSNPADHVLPAIQGGFDYTLGGLYLGNWNSSVGFAGGTEMDFYGGYKGELAAGLGYDVGVLTYYYPGDGNSSLNTTEIYAGLSYGIFSGKYSHTVSSKYFGFAKGSGTGYLDLSANYEFAPSWTLNAHVGYTSFTSGAKANGGADYTDIKLGVTKDFGAGLSAGLAYIDADNDKKWGGSGGVNERRFVLTLTKAM